MSSTFLFLFPFAFRFLLSFVYRMRLFDPLVNDGVIILIPTSCGSTFSTPRRLTHSFRFHV